MARTLVGQRIRDHRKARGWTQAALAAHVQISPSYLNLIESDRRSIAGALLKRIAEALGQPLEKFDGATERRLVDELGEIAADAALSPLQLADESAADLVARHPRWARALVALHRTGRERAQAIEAFSDRIGRDPLVGEAMHSLLTNIAAIRSASEILESTGELDPERRRRFVSIIASDSRRATQVSRSIAQLFANSPPAAASGTPADEVADFLDDNTNHFPALEAVAQDACAEAIEAEIRRARFTTPEAQHLARRALRSYVAGAILMPYASFHEAAEATRYDAELLARRFGASFEQVCHRLTTLRRRGSEGVHFGFMRTDPSGFISKRLALPGLPLPRHGNACPLWAVHAAFRTPGTIARQLVELPGGERFLMVARTVRKGPDAFGAPARLLSVMVFCDALQADRTVYADGLDLRATAPAIPVGSSCRVCSRSMCAWRQEDSNLPPTPATALAASAPWAAS